MKLLKIILGCDKANHPDDFSVFAVMELSSNKKNLLVDIMIKETVLKDTRNLPFLEANKIFEEEKERLVKKYNIPKENVL